MRVDGGVADIKAVYGDFSKPLIIILYKKSLFTFLQIKEHFCIKGLKSATPSTTPKIMYIYKANKSFYFTSEISIRYCLLSANANNKHNKK